jgi:hypothetical protein
MRQEIGIAIGKMWGIWYNTKTKVFEGADARAAKRAISLSLVTRSTAIKLLTLKVKTLK